ncbi:hepatic sodium/bile acid cotransporter-like [Tigriopus californicus]|nr:hepatic sodium/bile acid cotransporter-like [Tigriopus californicus]
MDTVFVRKWPLMEVVMGVLLLLGSLGPSEAFNVNDWRLDVLPLTLRGEELVQEELALSIQCVAEEGEEACQNLDQSHVNVHFEVDSKYFQFWIQEFSNYNYDEASDIWLESGYVPMELGSERNNTIRLRSAMLGIYALKFYYEDVDGEKQYFQASVPNEVDGTDISIARLVMARDSEKYMQYLNFFFTAILFVALFFMGIEIDINIVKQVLKKPIGPAIGFVSQFIFMPVAAYLVGRWILTQDYERLGLLILGSSPGGANSNFWTAMWGGDVNLSCTMTFISTLASFGMTSLWVFLLGAQYTAKDITMPYHMIAISLFSFIIPVGAGSLVKCKYGEKAVRVKNYAAKPFFALCLVVMPVVASFSNQYYFYLVTWRHLVAGLLVGTIGYVTGAGLAAICRQGRPQIIAISLETAIQNGGIAFVVLTMTFPSPYSEIGLFPVISFFFCSTGPILFVVFGIYELYRCATGQPTAWSEWRAGVKFRAVPAEDAEQAKTGKDPEFTLATDDDSNPIVKNLAGTLTFKPDTSR